jgi:molybdate transport repressor ModE-like protein
MPHQTRHAYKEIRLQQLRSFCETARLGSLTAAASSLGLSQPTVCEQVHSLERVVGNKLIERYARGCRLTDAGRVVAELAAPLVAGMDALERQIREALGRTETHLTIAATPRILVEDLPPAISAFQADHPEVRLRFLELRVEEVAAVVESGEADLGITLRNRTDPPNPRLVFEHGYELNLVLVTPPDHPLARKRRLAPADLVAYPLVNAPDSIPDPAVTGMLQKLGAFQTQPRRVEGYYTAVIRQFVGMGFGIGLILGLPSHAPAGDLYERSVSNHFGTLTIDLVWRKGTLTQGPARAFAHMVQTLLMEPAK